MVTEYFSFHQFPSVIKESTVYLCLSFINISAYSWDPYAKYREIYQEYYYKESCKTAVKILKFMSLTYFLHFLSYDLFLKG